MKVEGATKGKPPCARIGHSMSYLRVNHALVVIGGRNDELSKGLVTPFLNDIYIYSLHQHVWQQVLIHYPSSPGPTSDNAINKLCNHAAAIVHTDNSSDKVLILGGVQSKRQVSPEVIVSYGQPSLSGTLYILEFNSKMVRNSALVM